MANRWKVTAIIFTVLFIVQTSFSIWDYSCEELIRILFILLMAFFIAWTYRHDVEPKHKKSMRKGGENG